jgi:hypothetical protein
MFFNAKDAEDLLPVEVDDEYITASSITPQPPDDISLTRGFIVIARIYQCLMIQSASITRQSGLNHERWTKPEQCTCCIHGPPENEIRAFEHLYQRIQNVLNDLPHCLAPWQDGDNIDRIDNVPQWQDPFLRSPADPCEVAQIRCESLGSMRANIHITQLWCRFVIAERLCSLREYDRSMHEIYSTMLLPEHEFLCQQLLYLLSNISFRSLESNGISITFKIRQIAAVLLQYRDSSSSDGDLDASDDRRNGSIHEQGRQLDNLAQRAQGYIDKFMDILSRLDAFTFQDTQQVLWNATTHQNLA